MSVSIERRAMTVCARQPSRVHISESTLLNLADEYQVEPANGHERDAYIAKVGMKTYFIVPHDEANLQNQLTMK